MEQVCSVERTLDRNLLLVLAASKGTGWPANVGAEEFQSARAPDPINVQEGSK